LRTEYTGSSLVFCRLILTNARNNPTKLKSIQSKQVNIEVNKEIIQASNNDYED